MIACIVSFTSKQIVSVIRFSNLWNRYGFHTFRWRLSAL